MKAILEAFLQSLQGLSREQLIQKLLQMKEEEMNKSVILTEMRKTSTAMTKEYGKILGTNQKLTEENNRLKKEIRVLSEQNEHLLRDMYGRHSEKVTYMDEESNPKDPLSEDAAESGDSENASDGQSNETTNNSSDAPPAKPNRGNGLPRGKGSKGSIKGSATKKPRHGMNLDNLPENHIFDVDVAKLDAMYGPGNWEIINWHVRRKVEQIPELNYVEYTHVPVVSVGHNGKLIALPFGETLRKYSIATSSLVASIMFKKFAMGIPLYRQEWILQTRDFPLSRKDMSNWIVHFSLNLFGPVYDWMWTELKKCSYIQNDETTLQVINDGRKAGRLSYMWVHMTSELCDDVNPIVIFSYEMTRATEHLREYFSDYVGHMISDAYCSYYTFAGEHRDTITLAGCLMHARRPIALSAAVKGVAKLPEEEQKKMPEYRLLQLLAQIFDMENSFRELSAEERKACRDEEVRPVLDEYFQIIHTLDPDNPEYSEKMKKGIHYGLKYETELRCFLDDGHIPCHNGACERHIRPFSIARKVWLFCNTIDGAKATAILFTLVETAKANNVDVYYYLKYLLDKMPGHMEDHDRSFLADMMPWSEAFKIYAEKEKAELIQKYRLNTSNAPPLQGRHRSGPNNEVIA